VAFPGIEILICFALWANFTQRMIKISLERTQGDYGFEALDEKGHSLLTDSSSENGGLDAGFRPMQLLLAALGSCSAIDIVGILKKQRQQIGDFRMEIEGEREPGVIPSLWKKIAIQFHLSGEIDQEKAERAAALSIEKYCSVAETLRRAGATITWRVNVKNKQLT
jgi:putative redox protein